MDPFTRSDIASVAKPAFLSPLPILPLCGREIALLPFFHSRSPSDFKSETFYAEQTLDIGLRACWNVNSALRLWKNALLRNYELREIALISRCGVKLKVNEPCGHQGPFALHRQISRQEGRVRNAAHAANCVSVALRFGVMEPRCFGRSRFALHVSSFYA